MITLLWALALSAVVITLIYFERTAILYILCTLGVTALLVVVAVSDLTQSGERSGEVDHSRDASGVANRVS
jgi:hypothetical protein